VFVALSYGCKPALWVLANIIQSVLSEFVGYSETEMAGQLAISLHSIHDPIRMYRDFISSLQLLMTNNDLLRTKQ
jgi:hypothetical protein